MEYISCKDCACWYPKNESLEIKGRISIGGVHTKEGFCKLNPPVFENSRTDYPTTKSDDGCFHGVLKKKDEWSMEISKHALFDLVISATPILEFYGNKYTIAECIVNNNIRQYGTDSKIGLCDITLTLFCHDDGDEYLAKCVCSCVSDDFFKIILTSCGC